MLSNQWLMFSHSLSLGCCFSERTLYTGAQPHQHRIQLIMGAHSLSFAVSVFPFTHIHPTPICDHYGSLPLPVPERSKVILNPPLSLSKQTKLGFLSHHASVHVCVHVQWPQKVGSLWPHLKTLICTQYAVSNKNDKSA